MKTDVEDLGGSRKKLAFELTPEDLQEEIDKYCRKLAREVSIKGFRKGKAPLSVIKRYFKQQIHGEVSSQIVSSSLEKSLKEHSLTPLGEPDIDLPTLEEGKGFAFSVTLDVRPEIELRDYLGIEPEREPIEVREEEVEKSLEELRKAHAQLEAVEEDRGAVSGDILVVDYVARVEGDTVPRKEKKDVYLELGSGNYKKEVEEALIGARPGESREVEIEFPASYMVEEMAGKMLPHIFQVKRIMKKKLPALDDDFAKDVGAFDNLESLRARLRDQIVREKTVRGRRRLEERLLDIILERNPFEAPASLVKAKLGELMSDAKAHFLSQGLNLERDSQDMRKLEAEMQGLAEKEVKKQLLLDSIAKRESLAVSDAEVDEEIRRYAESTSQGVERIRAEIQKQDEGMVRFRHTILRQKTLDFLLPPDRMDQDEKSKENQ